MTDMPPAPAFKRPLVWNHQCQITWLIAQPGIPPYRFLILKNHEANSSGTWSQCFDLCFLPHLSNKLNSLIMSQFFVMGDLIWQRCICFLFWFAQNPTYKAMQIRGKVSMELSFCQSGNVLPWRNFWQNWQIDIHSRYAPNDWRWFFRRQVPTTLSLTLFAADWIAWNDAVRIIICAYMAASNPLFESWKNFTPWRRIIRLKCYQTRNHAQENTNGDQVNTSWRNWFYADSDYAGWNRTPKWKIQERSAQGRIPKVNIGINTCGEIFPS